MGFFSNLTSGLVKVALTPLAVIKDAADVIIGETPDNTKNLLKDAGKDFEKAMDDATGN